MGSLDPSLGASMSVQMAPNTSSEAYGPGGVRPRSNPPGVKPFPCPICGKRFSQKGNMKMHQRVHTGEKPFACPTCGKRFSQKGNMQTHTRIHSGVKPYECVECKQAFRQKSKLLAHMKRHQTSGSSNGSNTGPSPQQNQQQIAVQIRQLIALTKLNPSLVSKPLTMPLIPGMMPFSAASTSTTAASTHSSSDPVGPFLSTEVHSPSPYRSHSSEFALKRSLPPPPPSSLSMLTSANNSSGQGNWNSATSPALTGGDTFDASSFPPGPTPAPSSLPSHPSNNQHAHLRSHASDLLQSHVETKSNGSLSGMKRDLEASPSRPSVKEEYPSALVDEDEQPLPTKRLRLSSGRLPVAPPISALSLEEHGVSNSSSIAVGSSATLESSSLDPTGALSRYTGDEERGETCTRYGEAIHGGISNGMLSHLPSYNAHGLSSHGLSPATTGMDMMGHHSA